MRKEEMKSESEKGEKDEVLKKKEEKMKKRRRYCEGQEVLK